jgi:hypothetical protein
MNIIGDMKAVRFLLGANRNIGRKNKEFLWTKATAQAERYAHHVIQLKTSEEIKCYLSKRLKEISADMHLFDSSS